MMSFFYFDNYSGPAVIVYNERGHRIDEDLEVYPDDDAQTSRRSIGLNDPPSSSRPSTPVNVYSPSNPIAGGGLEHRTSTLSTRDAVERTPSNNNSKPSLFRRSHHLLHGL